MNPFIGAIFISALNYAPSGYAFCNGALMAISENDALFNLIGTTYGGDGQSTFALPDFQSRIPVGTGQGPGLNNVILADGNGVEARTLTAAQTPAHSHALLASTVAATVADPTGAALSTPSVFSPAYVPTTPDITMNATAIGASGGGQPFSIIQPVLGMNFIIALYGIYPSPN